MDNVFAYIDGFNLYHGAIREGRFHWLNLAAMCTALNSGVPVLSIKYFTAMVADTPDDLQKSIRQQLYHRALKTVPNLQIIKGNFQRSRVRRPVVNCGLSPACLVKVKNTNEKGSDVNLATHLLHDAHLNRFAAAMVVSGDSDLSEPIRIVAQELRKPVIVINPRQVKSKELEAVATFYRSIRPHVLKDSQFPDEIVVDASRITKPLRWSAPPPQLHLVIKATATCLTCQNQIECLRREPAPAGPTPANLAPPTPPAHPAPQSPPPAAAPPETSTSLAAPTPSPPSPKTTPPGSAWPPAPCNSRCRGR